MTDPPEEIRALRARLADLERLAAGGFDAQIRRASGRTDASARGRLQQSASGDFNEILRRRIIPEPQGDPDA